MQAVFSVRQTPFRPALSFHLIESQLKEAKNGRDKLLVSVLARCPLTKNSLYFLKREMHFIKLGFGWEKFRAILQTTLVRVSLTILD